ncbi:hypothetical protein AB0911_38600 [Streptomyces nigra]|uniref:hypothetical protein n=1 Tax=Streptomyces nigra TaxID=1827580 RepID=UPI00345474DF
MGSGIEVELSNILHFPEETVAMDYRGDVLAEKIQTDLQGRRFTVQIVVEDAAAYSDGMGGMHWRESEALQVAGVAYYFDVGIPEVIIGVVANSGSESYPSIEASRQWLSLIDRNIQAAMPQENVLPVAIHDVFPTSQGWSIGEAGRVIQIGQRIHGMSNTTRSVHYNVGVPLSMVYKLASGLHRSPHRDICRDSFERRQAIIMLGDSVEFGSKIASALARDKYNLDASLPNHIIAGLPDRDVQEVRGAATLLYGLASLAAHSAAYSNSLAKRYSSLLPRHNPADILAELTPNARAWLKNNAAGIVKEFERVYNYFAPTQPLDYSRQRGRRNISSAPETPLEINPRGSVQDLLLSGLDQTHSPRMGIEDIVFSNVLSSIDRSGPQPLIVLEARQYGENSISMDDVDSHHSRLAALAGTLHQKGASLSPDRLSPQCVQQHLAHAVANSAGVSTGTSLTAHKETSSPAPGARAGVAPRPRRY